MTNARHETQALLTLQRQGSGRLGEDRFHLLTAIAEEGSISGAARATGLSYKAAWDAVHAMNNLFRQPLVKGQSGGRRGGG